MLSPNRRKKSLMEKQLSIKKEVLNIVKEKYNIVDIIDLQFFDKNPQKLSEYLENYQNINFLINDRLLVLHHETEYYPLESSLGNTVYNFLKLCIINNIPSDYIIMFTNHYGLDKKIATVNKKLFNQPDCKVIYTVHWYDFPTYDCVNTICVNTNLTSDHIEELFICLNNVEREHRLFTLCALQNKKLLENGIVSYHFGEHRE
jgi:hypothetical protein